MPKAPTLFMRIMRSISARPLLVIFVAGLLLRLSLIFYDYTWDINNHIAWAKDLWARGPHDFYTTPSSEVYASIFPNYPPGALVIFYLVYPLQEAVFKLVWFLNTALPLFPSKLVFFVESRAFLAGLFKLPAICADLALAWLIVCIVKRLYPSQKRLPIVAAALILFNPAFFYNSALWGQIDAIPLVLAMGAFYALLHIKKPILSAVLFVLGLLVKPTILIFSPIYGFVLFRQESSKTIIKALIVAIIIFWLSFMPFIGWGESPFNVYLEKILATQSLLFVTNGAFNFWVFITYFDGVKDITPFLFGLSYRLWGYGIVACLLLIIIYYVLKTDTNNVRNYQERMYYSLGLLAFACFLFLTKMHERYSMLYLPFFLLMSLQKRKLIMYCMVLSLLSFLNLYHSWPVPKLGVITSFLYEKPVVLILTAAHLIGFIALWKCYVSFSSLYKK